MPQNGLPTMAEANALAGNKVPTMDEANSQLGGNPQQPAAPEQPANVPAEKGATSLQAPPQNQYSQNVEQVFKEYPALRSVGNPEDYLVQPASGAMLNALKTHNAGLEFQKKGETNYQWGDTKTTLDNPDKNRIYLNMEKLKPEEIQDAIKLDMVSHGMHGNAQYDAFVSDLDKKLRAKYGDKMVDNNGGADAYIRGHLSSSPEYQPYKDETKFLPQGYFDRLDNILKTPPTDYLSQVHPKVFDKGLLHQVGLNVSMFPALPPEKEIPTTEQTHPLTQWAQNQLAALKVPEVRQAMGMNEVTYEATKGYLGSIAGVGQGIQEFKIAAQERNPIAQNLEVLNSLVKLGFSGASLIIPQLMAFNTATEGAKDLFPPITKILAPVSSALQEYGGKIPFNGKVYDLTNNEGVKAGADLVDLLWNIALFHGAKEAGVKIKNGVTLNDADVQNMHRAVSEASQDFATASGELRDNLPPEKKLDGIALIQSRAKEEELKKQKPSSAPIHQHNIDALNAQIQELSGIKIDEAPPKPKAEGAEPEPKIPKGFREVKKAELMPADGEHIFNWKGTGKDITNGTEIKAEPSVEQPQSVAGDKGTTADTGLQPEINTDAKATAEKVGEIPPNNDKVLPIKNENEGKSPPTSKPLSKKQFREERKKFIEEKKQSDKEYKDKREQAKADAKSLKPTTPYEAALQYFGLGGKIRTEDLRKELGFSIQPGKGAFKGREEFNKRIALQSKAAPSMDDIVLSLVEQHANEHGHKVTGGAEDMANTELDQQDVRNAVIEVLNKHHSRNEMVDELQNLKHDRDFIDEHGMNQEQFDRMNELQQEDQQLAEQHGQDVIDESQKQLDAVDEHIESLTDEQAQNLSDALKKLYGDDYEQMAQDISDGAFLPKYYELPETKDHEGAIKEILSKFVADENSRIKAEPEKGTENVSEAGGDKQRQEENAPRTREQLTQELEAAKQELSTAESDYNKAKSALDKDLESKQQNLFQGGEQKLFDDTSEMKSKVDAAQKISEAAKEKVAGLQKLVDDNLEGQQEIPQVQSITDKIQLSKTEPVKGLLDEIENLPDGKEKDQLLQDYTEANVERVNKQQAIVEKGLTEETPEEPKGTAPIIYESSFIPKSGKEKILGFIKRELTSKGDLPQIVFDKKIEMEGLIRAQMNRLKRTVGDFRYAAKKAYDGNPTPEQMKDIDDALKSFAPGTINFALQKVPTELHPLIAEMRNSIDNLTQEMINTGAIQGDMIDVVTNNLGVYLTRSYRKFDDPDWVNKVPQDIVNKAKNYIINSYSNAGVVLTPEELQGLVDHLLYVEDAPIAILKGGKLGFKDLSILKRKGDIPEEIRALMGEYTDPVLNYSRSLFKMVNIIEKTKFLNDVKAEGMNQFLFEKPTGKHIVKIASDGSNPMAPLNGLYTTPEIKAAFEEFSTSKSLPDWYKAWLTVNGVAKYAKTIGSPQSQIRNFISNIGIMMANGHFNILKAKDAFTGIITDFNALKSDAAREKLNHYIELGIVGESVMGGEFRDVVRDATFHNDDLEGFYNSQVKKLASKAVDAPAKVYAANDDFFKIYAFENELAQYKKAYPNTPVPELEKQVAEIVRNTVPTYSMVPKLIKSIRRFPLLGSFVSWPAEIARTTYHVYAQALSEIKVPETRAIGIKRLASAMAVMSSTFALTALNRYVNNIDRQQDDAMREFMPPWNKNSQLLFVGKDDQGNYKYVDLSYTDPYNFLKKGLIAASNGKDINDAMIQALGEYAQPFFSEEIFTSKMLDLARNQTVDGRQVYNPQSDDRFAEMINHLWEGVEPGAITSAKRIYKGVKGEVSPGGRSYDAETEAFALITGQRISTLNIPQSFSFKARKFADDREQAKKIYNEVRYNKGTISEQQLNDAYDKANQAYKKLFDDFSKTVTAAQKLGMSVQQIGESFRQAGLPRYEWGHFVSGQYLPFQRNDNPKP